jgi:hypothetical protein
METLGQGACPPVYQVPVPQFLKQSWIDGFWNKERNVREERDK